MLQHNRELGKLKLLLLCISDLLKLFQTHGEIDCFLPLMEIELFPPVCVFINKLRQTLPLEHVLKQRCVFIESIMCIT